MTDLIDTTEMYLRTIYELEEEGIAPLRARIAERLGHSGPTVSQTVGRMERDDLVVVADDRQLLLTERGRGAAIRVMRKHRLAERLLTDVIGLDWPSVHEEACRWEHVISEAVERRLVALLDHPHFSPYGNPIPGLSELGDAGEVVGYLDGVVSVEDILQPAEVAIVRIAEGLQTNVEVLQELAAAGACPGARVVVEPGAVVTFTGPNGAASLAAADARHIFVADSR